MRIAGENLCSILTELGGKAPQLVFPDCDVEQAINGAAFASFIASGQTCIMGARLIIHESIYEHFMQKLAASISFAPHLAQKAKASPLVMTGEK